MPIRPFTAGPEARQRAGERMAAERTERERDLIARTLAAYTRDRADIGPEYAENIWGDTLRRKGAHPDQQV